MKRLYILATMLLCILSVNATTVISEDWAHCVDGELPSGWTTYGTDRTPTGIATESFTKGEGFKTMRLTEESSRIYAVSYSSTKEGGNVSTMLVTPELYIPASGAILQFTAANYNPDGTAANKMTVRISERGAEPADFTTVLLTKRVKSNSYAEPEIFSVSLAEYEGKEIRLAFVNEGSNAGLLGITDIVVADYLAQIMNYTPLLWQEGEPVAFDIDLSLTAQCKGFKATLTSGSGYSQTLSTDAVLDGSNVLVRLQFPDHPALPAGSTVDYTVSVTPNIDGCEPTVMTATTGWGEGFPAVLVEEEATGEKCGYCPAGAAGLEKFSDEFGDRFVGIGIHCTQSFSTGVMENHDYSDPFLSDRNFMITGLPSAVFNRKRIVNPTEFNLVQKEAEAVIASRSAAMVAIDRVECDFETGSCRVDFTASLALPFPNADISAAAVLIADNLKGYGPKWFQTDYYSGTSEQAFLKDADESWWPYMKFYCEYPSKNISPTDMAFNHVGMGIYPDYNGDGCLLPSDWTASQSASGSISFTMPMQEEVNEFGVQDINDTSIAVLVFNHSSGEILTATKVHASDYNKDLSGVAEINSRRDIIISNPTLGILEVICPERSHISIYSFDGQCVSSRPSEAQESFHLTPDRPYIVTVTSGSKSIARKIFVK